MSAHDDEDEVAGVVAGVVGGIALCVAAVFFSAGASPALPSATAAVSDIAPVGEPLMKVYFSVDQAVFVDEDNLVVVRTNQVLAATPKAIVLLSGFHDASGDPKHNAQLAMARAVAVRDVLVAGGVAAVRVKLRRPESTVGSGTPEEGRRVEIRVQ
ncbi:MAG TPA: OmpA family protein [Candidatus Accumulibacter phosphatis]|nr:MAG: 15 kDa peptidoglycan-associated lipoprotein [Candidatus Accumulibacter sp. SK-11]HAY28410.1 cell envelope biogenesis protein OmpA [Accumulibacter sp.]HRL76658.1 OmpA family protein [Candidatus Accumulibacter phosphatis]HCN66874.1 cell envelope biogenesis protein OmpA [Accumulibacter sp.]HCV14280.1 cell envelope biogenesis protein OmpA [Accumulibacter sp.]